MPRLFALALLLLFAAPAAAQAGTYHVYTCSTAGKVWANGAFKSTPSPGVSIDASCAGSSIALSVPAGTRMANNTSAALTFTSPAGTTIADFVLSRQLGYNNPVAADTHEVLPALHARPDAFAGAGNFSDATRNALNTGKQGIGTRTTTSRSQSTVSRASFPALATYTGNANVLHLRVGCYNRGTPCSVAAGAASATSCTAPTSRSTTRPRRPSPSRPRAWSRAGRAAARTR